MTDAVEESSETILDIYRLTVEMADRVSARRALANTFYVTVQAIFFAVVATAASAEEAAISWPIALAAIAGILVSAAWWLTLRSYRDLASAKWKVVGRIEETYLPIAPFNDEWRILKSNDEPKAWHERYAELGFIERYMPGVFAVLNSAALVLALIITPS